MTISHKTICRSPSSLSLNDDASTRQMTFKGGNLVETVSLSRLSAHSETMHLLFYCLGEGGRGRRAVKEAVLSSLRRRNNVRAAGKTGYMRLGEKHSLFSPLSLSLRVLSSPCGMFVSGSLPQEEWEDGNRSMKNLWWCGGGGGGGRRRMRKMERKMLEKYYRIVRESKQEKEKYIEQE